MSVIGIALNVLLAALLMAALGMGWRLNRRLQALRDSHDGFAIAVRELNTAAERAEQGLADLRAATNEATDVLGDRIEKGRALATRLDGLIKTGRLTARPAAQPEADPAAERRLGALLAAAREGRGQPDHLAPRAPLALRATIDPEDDLFEDAPLSLDGHRGARR